MKTRLIVNADDFGLCEPISRGIVHAWRHGIVTATSVVTVGAYFDQGIDLLKDTTLDAGIHLTWIGGEKPLTGAIRGLVDRDGRFNQKYRDIVAAVLAGRFDRDALRVELTAQVARLLDAGFKPSHLDAHQHLHLLPGIQDMIIDIALEFEIPCIRQPKSRRLAPVNLAVAWLQTGMARKLKRHNLNAPCFVGFDASGHCDQGALDRLLPGLKPGVNELMVHPGFDASHFYDWQFRWADEIKALSSDRTRYFLAKHNIELTDFKTCYAA